mgnify:FL=1|jgi:hypothetical protein
MNSSVDEKRECAKKIMHAIGELPDDMISKANPENWKDGVYIGEDKDTAGNVCDTGRRKITVISEWIRAKRKQVAFAATLFLCVIVAGVWKINSVGEHIEDNLKNEQPGQIIEGTGEPDSTYDPLTGVTKKKKRNKKNKGEKAEKKVSQNERKNYVHKNNGDKKSEESEPDSTELPEMKYFNDDNENHPDRRGAGTGEDGDKSDNTQAEKDDATEAPPQAAEPDTPYDTTPQESVTVYKLDSQGSKTAVNITSSDSLKIADIIDGKKYSQDVETNGYAAVLKYKGNEYYYDSKSKMLVVSGKGARLSESENAELKKIIKLD